MARKNKTAYSNGFSKKLQSLKIEINDFLNKHTLYAKFYKLKFLLVAFMIPLLISFENSSPPPAPPLDSTKEIIAFIKNEDFQNHFEFLKQLPGNLRRKNKLFKIDKILQNLITGDIDNLELLETLADTYSKIEHWGTLQNGIFFRGRHSGNYPNVSSYQRDRVQTIRLYEKGMHIINEKIPDKKIEIEFLRNFANTLIYKRGVAETFRLFKLTSTKKLPNFEVTDNFSYFIDEPLFAPVDKNAMPLFFSLRKSYENCLNDGEKWLFLISRIGKSDNSEYNFIVASYLYNLYGLITLKTLDSRILDLFFKDSHLLRDNETIAKTGIGVKKLLLPENLQYIKIFRKAADSTNSKYASKALKIISDIYINRRQYTKALKVLDEYIKRFGNTPEVKQTISQINDNLGTFLTCQPQPATHNAILKFQYRNAKSAHFTIYKLKLKNFIHAIKKLNGAKLQDSTPSALSLVQFEQQNLQANLSDDDIFIKETEWTAPLSPLENHIDSEISIKTPVKDKGCYLAVADLQSKSKLGKKNLAKMIFWLTDTVISLRRVKNSLIMSVKDFDTGAPIPNIKVELLNFNKVKIHDGLFNAYKTHLEIKEKVFNMITNDNGIYIFPESIIKKIQRGISVIILRNKGKFAFLNNKEIKKALSASSRSNPNKAYFLTDKSIYHPGDDLFFSALLGRTTQTEKIDSMPEKQYSVQIISSNEKIIFNKTYITDDTSSFCGSFKLPCDIKEGIYKFQINTFRCSGHFSIEKKKKQLLSLKTTATPSSNAKHDFLNISFAPLYENMNLQEKGDLTFRIYRSLFQTNSKTGKSNNNTASYKNLKLKFKPYAGLPKMVAKNTLTYENAEVIKIKFDISKDLQAFEDANILYDIIAEFNNTNFKKAYSHLRVIQKNTIKKSDKNPLDMRIKLNKKDISTPENQVIFSVKINNFQNFDKVKVLCLISDDKAYKKNQDAILDFFSSPQLSKENLVSSLQNQISQQNHTNNFFKELSIFNKIIKSAYNKKFFYDATNSRNTPPPSYPPIAYFGKPFNSFTFHEVQQVDNKGNTSFSFSLPPTKESWKVRCYAFGIKNKNLFLNYKNTIIKSF